jgi:purine nucleoside permease
MLALATPAMAEPIEVRMVVVTAFEIGADTGDRAGEFQAWAEAIPGTLPFPAGERPLRYDPVRQVLVVQTGIGTNRAATSTMALGLDPRFDLSHAYWLIAAIGGANPHVGSAAWIGDIVDTDYGYAVDPREAPKGWSSGLFARGRTRPGELPAPDAQYNLFPLDKGLRDWAFALTQAMPLPDRDVLARIRAGYPAGMPSQCPPAVIAGDEATGQTFWHGALLNAQFEAWTAYWTGRQGSFVMTGMEDSGVAHALDVLGRLHRADPARLLVLRTGSNFSVQPAGTDAASSLVGESRGLSALPDALHAAFAVGNRVVDEIAAHWPGYRDTIPSAAPAPLRQSCTSGGTHK